MKRAALYARFSSENQREESIMAQFRDGREYCRNKGYVIVKEYADEAKSGTTTVGRDQYNQMLVDAASDIFDVIIFHKVDRNARNEFDYYNTKRILNNLDISYEYSKQEIDSATSEGQFIESVMVGYSAYYSRNLSNEIKKGLRENAIQGKNTGGIPAYGYKSGQDKRLEINANEAPAVRIIFEMFNEGKSYKEILSALLLKGYLSRSGKAFTASAIHDIIVNVKYKGTMILGKSVVKGGKRNNRVRASNAQIYDNAVPAIVSVETFERAQAIMETRKHRRGAGKAKHIYALSGIIHCKSCGAPMTGHYSRNKKGYVSYYYRCKCGEPMMRQDEAESAVLTAIEKTFLTKQAKVRIKKMILEEVQSREHVDYKQQLEKVKKEYVTAKKRLNNLYLLVEDGDADEWDISRLKAQKAIIGGLKQSMKDLENRIEVGDPTAEMIDNILAHMDYLIHTKKAPEDFRELFRMLVSKVEVDSNSIVVVFMVTQESNRQKTLQVIQSMKRVQGKRPFIGSMTCTLA